MSEEAWAAGTPSGPSIDCVVPTHGRPEYLAECLASVAGQTRPPARVVVVSDDGDPRSESVVARVDRRAGGPSFEFVARVAGGPGASASRNAGADGGSSDLLAFLDDDDVWDPPYLAAAVEALERTGAAAAVCGIRRFPVPTDDSRIPTADLAPRDVFRRSPHVTGSSIVIRRSVFEHLGGFDPGLPVQNDRDLFLRLLQAGHVYAVVPQVLVGMRVHAGTRLTDPSPKRADGILLFLAKHGGQFSFGDRRLIRYLSHRTRLSADTSWPTTLVSGCGVLVNWSPEAGKQLPIGVWPRVVRLLQSRPAAGAA